MRSSRMILLNLVFVVLIVFTIFTLCSCGGGGIIIRILELVTPINGEQVQLPITFEWKLNMVENVEGTLTIFDMENEGIPIEHYTWNSDNYNPDTGNFKYIVNEAEWANVGMYGWKVQAIDQNGNIDESDIATFVIATTTCIPQITLVEPENLDEDVGTNVSFVWDATPCASGTLTYSLIVNYLNPAEDEESTVIHNLIGNQYPINTLPLEDGAIVEWSVVVYEEDYGSNTSSTGTFMVKPPPEEVSTPPNYASADMSFNRGSLTAEEFLYLLRKYIKDYKRIKIFVDSCHSGGIRKAIEGSNLDDIIVKTSSRWCEKSYTYTEEIKGKRRSYGLWTDELLKALKKADWTLKSADDRAYKSVTKQENAQHPTGYIPDDLSNEKLKDKSAQSHHVLLVSGNCVNIEDSCEEDMKNWWETLIKRGFKANEIASITNATTPQILDKFKNLSTKMNENEEFIFIFTGHGSKGQKISKEATINGRDVKNMQFILDPGVYLAMTSAISSPSITLSATTTQDCEVTMTVFLNEYELGSIGVATNDEIYPYVKFGFSMNIVSQEATNILTIMTDGSTGCIVVLKDMVIDSGTVPKEVKSE